MSKIGNWGQILKFQTSDSRVLTFSDMEHSADVAVAEHAVIVGKPKLQFIAPNLEEVTFSIELNAILCKNPYRVRLKLVDAMQKGLYAPLVVGNRLILQNALCTKVSASYDEVIRHGKIFALKIDVSMKEYW